MDLILIRHPAVALAGGMCYGQSDVPLALPPQAEVARLAARVEAMYPQGNLQFHSSTLSRCSEIARLLAARFNAALSTDARLQEIDFGRWELQAWDRVPRAELDQWAADIEHACAHGGESVARLALRVQHWLNEFESLSPPSAAPGAMVVVTHAGVMRVLAAQALRLPLAACLDWQLDLGAICRFQPRRGAPGWTLVAWNS